MADFFVNRKIVSEKRQTVKIYEYGLELILTDIINFTVILLISSVL